MNEKELMAAILHSVRKLRSQSNLVYKCIGELHKINRQMLQKINIYRFTIIYFRGNENDDVIQRVLKKNLPQHHELRRAF